MRKIVVLEFITLDGVIQAPGGEGEDPSGDFDLEGWIAHYSDKMIGEEMSRQMGQPFDLLLGRKTYDIFARYWPGRETPFNSVVKYVVSNSSDVNTEWKETVQLSGDVTTKIRELKQGEGPMLQVFGSSVLVQTLLGNDLVDELWLKIYPVTLGKGKRLFGDGVIPAAFELIDSKITSNGVIIASYRRAGEVKLGTVSE
jgi:dihydrofolate reductase